MKRQSAKSASFVPASSHRPAATGTAPNENGRSVILLKPRGFCAGVIRAIDIVELALERYGAPIYVRRQIVHNSFAVRELAARGAIFVEEIEDVPPGARVVFSAHGVSPAVRTAAERQGLQVIDATCPLVTKVHSELLVLARRGWTVILIGHRDHDEVVGTFGEAPESTVIVSSVAEAEDLEVPDPERLAYLTQTTLSLDDTANIVEVLRRRFPGIQGPSSQDICYATQNRQLAVKQFADGCDFLLVVGSANSSNAQRLCEVAANMGIPAELVEDSSFVDPQWFPEVRTVAVTAGASTPEHLVEGIVELLRSCGFNHVQEVELLQEDLRFSLPPELVRIQ